MHTSTTSSPATHSAKTRASKTAFSRTISRTRCRNSRPRQQMATHAYRRRNPHASAQKRASSHDRILGANGRRPGVTTTAGILRRGSSGRERRSPASMTPQRPHHDIRARTPTAQNAAAGRAQIQKCVGHVGQTPSCSRLSTARGGAEVAGRVAGRGSRVPPVRGLATKPSGRRKRGDRARCDRCGQLRPRACRYRFLPGRALQPVTPEAAEVVHYMRRRVAASGIGSTAPELARDVGSTTARVERILQHLQSAGHCRPDRWRSRWMPTDYVGLFERMPAVRSVIDRLAAADAATLPPGLRPAAADARSIMSDITGSGYVPATGGRTLPAHLETPGNGTRAVDSLAGVGGGGGRRRVRGSGSARGTGPGRTS